MNNLDQQMNYIDIIVSYLSGNTTEEEKQFIQTWIKESPENLKIFDETKLAWLSSSLLATPGKHNHLKAYNTVISKIKENKENNSLSINSNKIKSGNFLKIAALLLFMVFIGGVSSYFITRSVYTKQSTGNYFVEAPIGSRAIATLPDGTRIWLNAGSKLEYATDYNNKTREVQLTGEGYFNVKTNPAKPFLVKTHNLTIKATGTSFNVKAYPTEKLVTTTLVEGKVELEGKGTNNQGFSYQMKPKQKVTYFNDEKQFAEVHTAQKKSGVIINVTEKNEKIELPLLEKAPIVTNTNVKTELYTSWKDERWIIESEKLCDLAILFERRYNVKIIFNTDEIKNYRFSATIQNETIEQIFDIMRFTLPISYIADKGKITLRSDKRLKNIYRSAYQKE